MVVVAEQVVGLGNFVLGNKTMSIQSMIAMITPNVFAEPGEGSSVLGRPDPLDCEVCPWAAHMVRVKGRYCDGKQECPMRNVRQSWGY